MGPHRHGQKFVRVYYEVCSEADAEAYSREHPDRIAALGLAGCGGGSPIDEGGEGS